MEEYIHTGFLRDNKTYRNISLLLSFFPAVFLRKIIIIEIFSFFPRFFAAVFISKIIIRDFFLVLCCGFSNFCRILNLISEWPLVIQKSQHVPIQFRNISPSLVLFFFCLSLIFSWFFRTFSEKVFPSFVLFFLLLIFCIFFRTFSEYSFLISSFFVDFSQPIRNFIS